MASPSMTTLQSQQGDDIEGRAGIKTDQDGEQTQTASRRDSSVPEKESQQDGKLVSFDESLAEGPLQWSRAKKWTIIAVVSTCSMCVTCASSVASSAYADIEREFGIGAEVATLSLSLYALGTGIGPLLIAPFSEFYGRRPVYIISLSAFFLLGFPVAFANNAAVFIIFRFLTGFVGSAFLSVAGGTVSDMYPIKDSYLPMSLYTTSPFFGPVLGPVYSGFIVEFGDWRWSFYVILIWAFVQLVLIVFLTPETFAPQLLIQKAKRLRKQTGDPSYYAQHERTLQSKSLPQTVEASVKRVFLLLTLEPMLLLLCLWCAILLGILYLFFELFPIVFAKHNFTPYQDGLSFLGLGLGIVIGFFIMIYYAARYKGQSEANGGRAEPEARLDAAKLGAFLCPISLFIFGFTSYEHVHWIAPILGSIPFGTGCILIFCSVFTFITDNWPPVAASALGANSFCRASFACAFPLFASEMAAAMGTTGAACFLAGLNMLVIPLPFVFARYGPQIRAKSKFKL